MAVTAWEIEKRGDIALGWHLLPDWYEKQGDHIAEQEGVAEILDRVHFEKIRMADEVLIINCEGYIGEQTRREIKFAESLGKPIAYLEAVETVLERRIDMIKLSAEDRAKRALDYSLPFLGDTVERWGCPSDLEGIVEPEGMPTTRTINAVGRIVKEIHEAEEAARRKAMEKCLARVEELEGLYGKNLGCCDVSGAICALIEEKE